MMKKQKLGLMALLAMSGWACEETVIERVPDVECNNLDFGEVAVTETRDLTMECRSTGSGALEVENIVIENPSDNVQAAYSLTDPEGARAALDGLAPNETAMIEVRFTPCAAATMNPGGIGSCQPGPADGSLTLLDNVDDNGPSGPSSFQLAGVAALPPNPRFRCDVSGGGMGCGNTNTNSNFSDCRQLNFGAIGVDGQACDLYVEVINEARDDVDGDGQSEAVAPFQIFDFSFNIFDGTSDVDLPISAEEAGFRVLAVDRMDESGNLVPVDPPEPLNPGATSPWTIPGTGDEERRLFVVRLEPTSAGTFLGDQIDGDGLIMQTNAADEDSDGTENIGILGTVQVPELAITCDGSQVRCGDDLRFRDVDLNVESTKTCNLSQVGDGSLNITSAELSGDDELTLQGLNAPIMNVLSEPFILAYTPTDGTPDTASLTIESNDPGNSPCQINILGGDLPSLRARPNTLFYQSTGTMRVCQDLTVQNVGDADLVLDGVEVEVEEQNAESADDFSFTEETFPITVAPDGEVTFEVCYENDDNSTFDAADLVIASNDPSSPDFVALQAETDPCLGPAVNFTINPINMRSFLCARGENDLPGEGPENIISLSDSFGGGTMDEPATVVSCELEVILGSVLNFDPNPTTLQGDNLEVRVEALPFMGSGRQVAIEATCTNSCGSQGSAVERLAIFPKSSENCP